MRPPVDVHYHEPLWLTRLLSVVPMDIDEDNRDGKCEYFISCYGHVHISNIRYYNQLLLLLLLLLSLLPLLLHQLQHQLIMVSIIYYFNIGEKSYLSNTLLIFRFSLFSCSSIFRHGNSSCSSHTSSCCHSFRSCCFFCTCCICCCCCAFFFWW